MEEDHTYLEIEILSWLVNQINLSAKLSMIEAKIRSLASTLPLPRGVEPTASKHFFHNFRKTQVRKTSFCIIKFQ